MEAGNPEKIREMLKDLVDDYQPQGDLADWLWLDTEKDSPGCSLH
jgi:hypothetical protein